MYEDKSFMIINFCALRHALEFTPMFRERLRERERKIDFLIDMVLSLLNCVKSLGSFAGEMHKKAWIAVPLCIFLTIWKEMNKIVFDTNRL